MSETKETTAVAPRNQSVAAATFAPMEGYDEKDVRGKEDIRTDELQLPFLSIAQKTSTVVDKGEDAYIEGIEFFDMYNSATKQVYGRGPLNFLVVRGPLRRAYIPDENGRMGEDIPWDDPRCDWPEGEAKKNWKGKGKPKPEGVRVLDYVCLLLTEMGIEPVTISFKSKSFTAGNMLQTFIGLVRGPVFTAMFAVRSNEDSNDAGKFGKFAVLPAGKPSKEQADMAAAFYEAIKDKKIAVKDDGVSDADETGAPAATEGTKKGPGDIPF